MRTASFVFDVNHDFASFGLDVGFDVGFDVFCVGHIFEDSEEGAYKSSFTGKEVRGEGVGMKGAVQSFRRDRTCHVLASLRVIPRARVPHARSIASENR